MSYNASAAGPKTEVAEVAREALAAYEPYDSAVAEAREHLDAAADAVAALVPAIGLDDDHISVSVSGHANVLHGHVDGWADEQITITVSVRRPEATEESTA